MQIINLKQTCSACPSQWEGELDNGNHIYIRYRYGKLFVGVGEDIDEAILNSNPIKTLGDEYDGVLTEGDMMQVLEEEFNIY